MEKLSQNKLIAKIICLALSIILWIYVSYQENPSMTKTINNVPIAITGEQALRENGFCVYSISEKSVDVKATAKRLSLRKLSNKTLTATINVSSIRTKGKYSIPATVTSSVATSASYYVKGDDITVVIEPMLSKIFPSHAKISDSTGTDVYVKSASCSVRNIRVTAPKSILKQVSTVSTQQIEPGSKKESEIDNVKVVAYGKDGKELDGVECNPSNVNVTLSYYDVKKVPVFVRLTNGESEQLPKQDMIVIYGSGQAFEETSAIYTEPVSPSAYNNGNTVSVKLKIPDGVYTNQSTMLKISNQ